MHPDDFDEKEPKNANWTKITKNNLSFVFGERRSAREIVDFIRSGAEFRSFDYLITQMRPDINVKKVISEGLAQMTGENYTSLSKKVGNWLKGKNLPKSRETIFQICFSLSLTEEEANRVLGRISDTGIHYRNPEELAYAFALRTGMSYADALKLKEKVLEICRVTSAAELSEPADVYTRQVRNDFAVIEGEEDFLDFIRANAAKLGTLHNSAYREFTHLLDELQNPPYWYESEGIPEPGGKPHEEHRDEGYTLADVMREYMQMSVPVQKKKASKAANTVQTRELEIYKKMVRQYWPSESTLIRMRGRKEDVNRKTLLLLYLATEAFDIEDSYEEEDWDEMGFDLYEDVEDDPDLLLEKRIRQMNLFLDEYGMNQLDPGQPFDLLMIYAMHTEEDEEARLRMEEVLALLFEESKED